jgi:hypothetical protein
MNLRMFIDDQKLHGFNQDLEDFAVESSGLGWPKDTWFQKRLEFVRNQQRKKGPETELIYECSLGTISFRQRNGAD